MSSSKPCSAPGSPGSASTTKASTPTAWSIPTGGPSPAGGAAGRDPSTTGRRTTSTIAPAGPTSSESAGVSNALSELGLSLVPEVAHGLAGRCRLAARAAPGHAAARDLPARHADLPGHLRAAAHHHQARGRRAGGVRGRPGARADRRRRPERDGGELQLGPGRGPARGDDPLLELRPRLARLPRPRPAPAAEAGPAPPGARRRDAAPKHAAGADHRRGADEPAPAERG